MPGKTNKRQGVGPSGNLPDYMGHWKGEGRAAESVERR